MPALTSRLARRARHTFALSLAVCVGLVASACGGGDSATAPPTTTHPPTTAIASTLTWTAGDGQTARLNTAVGTAPAVRVVDAAGTPVLNVPVTFTVTAGGGRVATTNATSTADGVAVAGTWTLGASPGDNALTATVAAGGGAPLTTTLHATARPPRWTVMVYMAADNTLAESGVQDVDKMEAAGVDPEVQTVVQAEFSKAEFARQGCGAECAHLTSFDTFRYQVTGGQPHVTGPDGPVTYIGNRDMTDPAQLREFVAWAKAAAPAEHYALVLWNHGSGYGGLLEDDTSRPGHFMSLAELNTALAGTGGFDVVDFDMCLMAGYETLAELSGIAKVAVFSEQTEPGSGVPYTEALKGLAAQSTLDARGVGALFVRAWDGFYRGGKESTTQSAYDLAAFPGFEQALGTVAATLRGSTGTFGTAVQAAGAASQHYAHSWLKDVGDFTDSLAAHVDDATLRTQLAALKAQATSPDFRVAQYAANGTADSTDVSHSTGLHVLLPTSALPATGPESFTAYQSQFGARPWTQFLTAYLGGATTTATVDQGDRALQFYLMWDSTAVAHQVDVDLWVLEPNGNVYIPWKGTVTPNGHMSDDSQDAHTFYEGYATSRYVQAGAYRVFAYLHADPQDFRPSYDLVWRRGTIDDFASLFAPTYPRLSKATPMASDSAPTWDKVAQGAYSDLRPAATFSLGASATASRGVADSPRFAVAPTTGGPQPTRAQLLTLRRIMQEARQAKRAAVGRGPWSTRSQAVRVPASVLGRLAPTPAGSAR